LLDFLDPRNAIRLASEIYACSGPLPVNESSEPQTMKPAISHPLPARPLTGAHFRNWKEGSFQLPFFIDVGLRLFLFEDLAVGHRPRGALRMLFA
jgi:hypothetical protein